MSQLHDVAVIGTGAGGLTAALFLQRAHHSVLLLEAGKAFGGMLNPFSRRGVDFDVGVHYLGDLGPGQRFRGVLDSLGLESVRFRQINPDCIDRYIFGGYETRLVAGVDRWCELLAADFPAEREALQRFAKLLKTVDALINLMMLRWDALWHAPSMLRSSREIARLFTETYGALLARYFKDPLLRAAIAGPTGLLGMPPGRVGAFMSMAVTLHYLNGAYYPEGGSRALRDAFVDALKAGGAELLRNRPVTRIHRAADGTFVLRTGGGEEFRARAVISNADIHQTLGMLEELRPGWLTRRRAQRSRPSLGAMTLYLATDCDLTRFGLGDTNIWDYSSPDLDAAYQELYEGQLPERPFVFISSATLKDPSLRVKGLHTLELLTYLPGQQSFSRWFDVPTKKRGPDYEELKQRQAEVLVRQVERHVPGVRDHIVIQDCATPATVWSYVRGQMGGIFGPESTPEQSPLRRPFPVTGIPGLFLTGASVGGPGVFSCVMSGMFAGRHCASFLRSRKKGALAA